MTTRSLLSSFIAVVFATSCATNPAKNLEPNGVDLTVNANVQPVGLYRGEEQVDEQDFYRLAGDTESYEAVKASRGAGSAMQIGGMSLITVGALAVAFGFLNGLFADGGVLGEKGLYPKDAIGGLTGYLIAGAGGVGIAGGAWMFAAGGSKVRGEPPVFDLNHAQASLETGRYGAGGLSPEHITSLELTTNTGVASYCALSGAVVKPLVGRDKDGKDVSLQRHLDWVTVSSTPDALTVTDEYTGISSFTSEEDETVEGTFTREASAKTPPKQYVVRSPLTQSLLNYGVPVTVTAKVNATGLTKVLALEQSLTCAEFVDFAGERGRPGASGERGSSGNSSRGPSPGGAGVAGVDGAMGPDVDVEAAWLKDQTGRRVALVAWQSGGTSGTTLLAPGGSLRVVASGGAGGSGGRGGEGGRGVDGNSKRCPSDGAAGGSGGSGGRGGAGGRVLLQLADESLSSLVSGSAEGGSGGSAGRGGSGGSAGSSSKGCSTARRGGQGGSGGPGTSGPPGTVTKRVVPASSLPMIQRALSTMKGFSLADAADVPVNEPKSRRR